MRQIKTNKVDDITMVWYLDDTKTAVVADVYKCHLQGWIVKFRGQVKRGFYNRADAICDAKQILKRSM